MVRMKENDHEAKNFENFWGPYADEITYTDYRNQDGLDKVDRYTKKEKRINLTLVQHYGKDLQLMQLVKSLHVVEMLVKDLL